MSIEFLNTLHSVMGIVCPASLIAAALLLPVSLYLTSRCKQQNKRSRIPFFLGFGSVCLVILCYVLYFMISVKLYSQSENRMAELPAFTVTSENLHDGVWDDVIGRDKGENKSPQLSWEPVEGAESYAIVMIDETARNWMHWKTASVTETSLPLGFAGTDAYVGPYPPAGETHTYTIYVVALRQKKDGMSGTLDAPNDEPDHDVKRSLSSLDTVDGQTGNALAMGTILGAFTSDGG